MKSQTANISLHAAVAVAGKELVRRLGARHPVVQKLQERAGLVEQLRQSSRWDEIILAADARRTGIFASCFAGESCDLAVIEQRLAAAPELRLIETCRDQLANWRARLRRDIGDIEADLVFIAGKLNVTSELPADLRNMSAAPGQCATDGMAAASL
jgi:hypothetical protein